MNLKVIISGVVCSFNVILLPDVWMGPALFAAGLVSLCPYLFMAARSTFQLGFRLLSHTYKTFINLRRKKL